MVRIRIITCMAAAAAALSLLGAGVSHSAGGALVVEEARTETTLTGYTRAAASMNLVSEVSGRIRKISYEIGQAVGDAPFIEVDTSIIDHKIESAEASLAKLAASAERAKSHAEYQAKEYGRIRKLYDQESIAEVEHDRSRQALDQASLELSAIEAERRAVEAAIGELRVVRSKHMISVPRGWVIVGRTVEPGEVVQPGMPVGRAADFQRLVAPMSLSTEEIEALRAIKQPFAITVAGLPARATLNWVNPEFNERTRKSEAEILISSYEGQRRGGLAVSITALVKTEGLIVPSAAVTDRYANPTVTPRGAAKPVRVLVTGQTSSGLIIANTPELRPGMELLPSAIGSPAGK